jgi:hypothetical protein
VYSEIEPLQNNHGLGWYPFKPQWVCSMGAIGYPYEDCICGILEYANYNWTDKDGGHPCRATFGLKPGTCFNMDEIEEVINAYHTLIKNNEIAEYEVGKPSSIAVITAVSTVSMKEYDRVKHILDSLTWATQNRKIKSAWCLFPKSYNTTKDYQVNTDTENSGQAKIGGAVDWVANVFKTTIATAKTILYVAAGGAIVVGGIYLYNFLPKPRDKK